MSLTSPAAPASWLALATTLHLGLAVWLHDRRKGRTWMPMVVVSTAFAGAPWVMPTTVGLAVGVFAHLGWFATWCRRARQSITAAGANTAVAIGKRHTARAASAATPTTFVPAAVLAVTDQSEQVRTFRFARPEGFQFVAGQFLPIRVTIAGRDHVRCYSISSAPHAREYLEISVKRQGLVSTALHTLVKPGTIVQLKAPAGAFTYPVDRERPLLLLAGGIGITPLISMLRHAVQAEPQRTVTLLYSASSVSGLAFRSEIKALVRESDAANAIFAVTRGATTPDVYPGRIDAGLIQTAVPRVADAIACLCGPRPMVDAMRAMLTTLGVSADRIRTEVFEAALAVAAGRTRRASADARAHQVHCARSGRALQVEAGQTLLEAVEAGGVRIDSLCRSGVCGTCRTRVAEGDVDCESTLLADADRAAGYVLACVTHVHGDCVVEV